MSGTNSRKWELTLSDSDSNTFVADLHSEALLLDGTEIGLTKDECVIPVFKSKLIASNEWILGTIFLQYYYVVFDMSGLHQNKVDYIQVGIGEKNPEDLIGESIYLSASPAYSPTAGSDDQSSRVSGSVASALCFACPGPNKPVPIKPRSAATGSSWWSEHHLVVLIAGGSIILVILLIVLIRCLVTRCRKTNMYYDRTYS